MCDGRHSSGVVQLLFFSILHTLPTERSKNHRTAQQIAMVVPWVSLQLLISQPTVNVKHDHRPRIMSSNFRTDHLCRELDLSGPLQYTAGSIFRYVEHGFQKDVDFYAGLSDEEIREEGRKTVGVGHWDVFHDEGAFRFHIDTHGSYHGTEYLVQRATLHLEASS